MAIARARRDSGMNYWPGFVDALSTLILGIIFLLTVFVVVQFYLTQEVTGKDTALARLNAQIAQLTELLSLEKTGKLSIEETVTQLRASLVMAEGERDRFRGLYEGVGSGAADAQGKVAELSGQLDNERRMGARALAQIEDEPTTTSIKVPVSTTTPTSRLSSGARNVPTAATAKIHALGLTHWNATACHRLSGWG